jgi:hypothetical protein
MTVKHITIRTNNMWTKLQEVGLFPVVCKKKMNFSKLVILIPPKYIYNYTIFYQILQVKIILMYSNGINMHSTYFAID